MVSRGRRGGEGVGRGELGAIGGCSLRCLLGRCSGAKSACTSWRACLPICALHWHPTHPLPAVQGQPAPAPRPPSRHPPPSPAPRPPRCRPSTPSGQLPAPPAHRGSEGAVLRARRAAASPLAPGCASHAGLSARQAEIGAPPMQQDAGGGARGRGRQGGTLPPRGGGFVSCALVSLARARGGGAAHLQLQELTLPQAVSGQGQRCLRLPPLLLLRRARGVGLRTWGGTSPAARPSNTPAPTAHPQPPAPFLTPPHPTPRRCAQVLRVLCLWALLRLVQLRQLPQQPRAREHAPGGGGVHTGAQPQRLPPQDHGGRAPGGEWESERVGGLCCELELIPPAATRPLISHAPTHTQRRRPRTAAPATTRAATAKNRVA